MILWINWLAFILQSLGLIVAQPGPMPSQFPELSALVARHAGDLAGKPDPWPIILQAAEVYDLTRQEVEAKFNPEPNAGDRVNFWPDALTRTPDPDDGERERLERDAATYGMSLLEQRDLFNILSALPGSGVSLCWTPPEGGNPRFWRCPHLTKARALARVLATRMELAAERADWDIYQSALTQGLALARVTSFIPGLIARMSADLTTRTLCDRVRCDVLLGRIPADRLRPLLDALESQGEPPPTRFVLESVALSLDPAIAVLHTNDDGGDGYLLIEPWRRMVFNSGALASLFTDEQERHAAPLDWPDWGRVLNAGGVLFARRAETTRTGHAFNQRLLALSDKPYAQQLAGAAAAAAWARALPERQPVIAVLGAWTADGLGLAFQYRDDALVARRGAATLLAIEAYRAEQGRTPESLDALTPGFLRAVPIDPYTLTPFAYRVTNPRTTRRADGYLLYSAWNDGNDDGGKRHHGQSQWTATTKMRTGFDFVINDEQDAHAR